MSAESLEEMVHRFLDALESWDMERARAFLDEDQFHYRGPIDTFDNPRDFLDDFAKLETILKRVERRRIIASGDEACAILTFHTTIAEIEQTRVAVWIKARNGKLSSLEGFLDVRAYSQMFGPEP